MQFEATARNAEEGENSMSLVRVFTNRAALGRLKSGNWNDVLIIVELRLKWEKYCSWVQFRWICFQRGCTFTSKRGSFSAGVSITISEYTTLYVSFDSFGYRFLCIPLQKRNSSLCFYSCYRAPNRFLRLNYREQSIPSFSLRFSSGRNDPLLYLTCIRLWKPIRLQIILANHLDPSALDNRFCVEWLHWIECWGNRKLLRSK